MIEGTLDPGQVARVLSGIGAEHCAAVQHAVGRVDAVHAVQMEQVLAVCFALAKINTLRSVLPTEIRGLGG